MFPGTSKQDAVGIGHVGLDGSWLHVNQRLCDMLGYSREELMNLTLQDVTHADGLTTDIDHVRKMLKGEIQTYAIEKRCVHKKGTPVWTNLTVSLAGHRKGDASHFLLLVEDISARKNSEKIQKNHLYLLTNLERINRVVSSAINLEQMMRDVLEAVLSIFDCDRAFLLFPCDPDSSFWRVPMERTVPGYPGAEALNRDFPMQPWVVEILRVLLETDGVAVFGPQEGEPLPPEGWDQFHIQSAMAMAVYPKGDKPWMFGMHQCAFPRIWSEDEKTLFREIGRRISDSLTTLQAFRKLQKSEDRFRTLVENLPGCVYRSELKNPWRLEYVSESVLELTGYSPSQFTETNEINFGDLILDEDLQEVGRLVEEGVSNRSHYESEYRIRHASGDVRWVFEKGRASYDEGDNPRWLDGVIVDITERKNIENRLRNSEARLKEAQKMAKLGHWKLDVKTGDCEWSDETYRIFRLDPETFKPQIDSIMALSPWPGDHERDQEIIKRVTENREQGSFEQRFLRPDGSIGYYVSIFRGVFDDHDNLVRIMGTIQDVTEQKRTNEALKKSEATLRSIFESSPMLMGIVELTADDKIVHIYDNPATARFFNVESQGAGEIAADELGAPSEAISEWLVHYRQSQNEGKPVRFEYIHPAPDGPLWLSATVSTIGPGRNGRTRFSYVAEDITERKQGEVKLQEYAETQEVLLREVNHRVKNNLAVIISMLHKEEDLAKLKGQTAPLSLLHDLEGRIRGLLTVHSMFSASNWQPLFLSQLCRQIIKGNIDSNTAAIKLSVSASDVLVDSNQAHHLSMVINELTTNTLKYAIRKGNRSRIDVDIKDDAGKVFLTFRDNGPGYPENIIKGNYAGASIGFELVTGIVKKSLRGTISFKNENGAVIEIGFDTIGK
ncbi:PAS domain S-box protein [Desulfosarcina alkanivorans]|nr:PAS domain S-box protein [Desulfosarcina alkanivorans]